MFNCCEYCNDGTGLSRYPYYGLAPHAHIGKFIFGSTKISPKEEWPVHFREDPEDPNQGIYDYCPVCGVGTTEDYAFCGEIPAERLSYENITFINQMKNKY